MTKEDNFFWNIEAQRSFDPLKAAVTLAPDPALPDFSEPFVVEFDVSRRGIGAVLMQQQRPIAFFSRALSDRTLAKLAYERESVKLWL